METGAVTVIGCDVGTQSTKGVLVSESGDVISTASARHAVEFPAAGWAQQDPLEWLSAVRTVVSTLAAESPDPVRCVGVSAQVDGVVATNDRLQPLHPALIWMDRRSADSAAEVGHRLGMDEIFAVTGLNCDGSHGGPKMRWLLDHLTEDPAHLLPPATVVTSWLTGNVAQDHANASSSMLYDVSSRTWSPMMTEAFGVDPETLPTIVDATDEIGSVRPALAGDLGLSPDCLVVAGTGDD
ncbi:MAG: FGGY family carbohydrate kinase, partial [Acidimicrobiia bacterium]